MEDTRDPQEAFAFEFDDVGVVSGMRIADDWTKFLELDQFGSALLLAYAEQHAAATIGSPEAFAPGRPDVTYPREFRDDVIDLSRDVSALFEALASWSPEPQEPVEVGDRHRHIIVKAVGGTPNEITVNETWLRTADFADIETDIVEAFQAMSREAPASEIQGQLSGLQERLAGLVSRRNDHSRG